MVCVYLWTMVKGLGVCNVIPKIVRSELRNTIILYSKRFVVESGQNNNKSHRGLSFFCRSHLLSFFRFSVKRGSYCRPYLNVCFCLFSFFVSVYTILTGKIGPIITAMGGKGVFLFNFSTVSRIVEKNRANIERNMVHFVKRTIDLRLCFVDTFMIVQG